jgi:predicted nuclease of predicted toxin-antitoxin system
VRLLLDEHISGKVADRLRRRGHDVVAAIAVPDLRGTRDAELFEVAQREARAIVTYNRGDFETLIREYARAGRPHHGVVIVPPIRFPGGEFSRLTAALSALLGGPDLGGNFVIWLSPSAPP